MKKLWIIVLVLSLCMTAVVKAEGFSVAGFDLTDNHDWSNNFCLERIEEKTGVKITYTQYTSEEDWKNAKAAMTADSADLPDALFKADLSRDEMQELYDRGVLIDLRPLLETYAPNLWALLQQNPEWLASIELADGAIVALPNINPLQNNNAIWINTVWLERVGMSMPTTAEELTQVLRAFKTMDPNRNGKADEVPLTFTGMWDLRWLGHAFGLVSNDYYITETDGVVSQIVTSEQNRAFLTWLHQLYAEGLIDRTGFTSTETTRQITDSSATITYGVVLGPSIMNLLPSSELNNYAVLIPLEYEGKRVYRQLLYPVSGGTFAITSKCTSPEVLLAWADNFYTTEYCYLTQAGLPDKEYEVYSDGKWHWIESASTVSTTIMPDYTIANGTMMPGYTPLEFQTLYDDEQTSRAVSQLVELNGYGVYPYPPVNPDAQTQARIDAIWSQLGPYCEMTMARFVTGDYEINDGTWNAFAEQAEAYGLSEMVSIWQQLIQ